MFGRVLVLVGVLLLPASGAWATPFVNGSFETGPIPGGFITLAVGSTAITGWEVFQDNIDYIGTHWQAADGVRSLDLNGNSGPGGIRQTFDTSAGTPYRVDFALAGNPDGPDLQLKTVQITSGAFSQSYVFSTLGTTPANMNWGYQSFIFTAASGTSTLSFASTTASQFYGPALDDVSVTPVPEPATLSLIGLGLAGLRARRLRRK